MPRSSTSSSERGALAGVAALLLLLALDAGVYRVPGFWELVRERAAGNALATGVALDQLGLRELRRVPEGVARVAVLGSSRALAFRPPAGAEGSARPPIHWARFAHGGVDPFAIRSLSDALAAAGLDVAVLYLSEFDTHRPVAPRADTSYGSLAAVVELARAAGSGRSFAARTDLLRLALACGVRSYRFRGALEVLGLDALRRFDLGVRFDPVWMRMLESTAIVPGGTPLVLDPRRRVELDAEMRRRFGAEQRGELRAEVERVETITRGPHVRVQMQLIRSAVARLRDAGVRVVIFEGPLSPLAAELYDHALREEFAAFARELARTPGVAFAALDAAYVEEDFVDLSHASAAGARRLSAALERSVRRSLEQAR